MDSQGESFLNLLPIEWVEKVPKYSPPRGCIPPMAGQNRREQLGFRSGCLASARHLSPTPFRKTECHLRSGQPNHFPTRTDETPAASLCPAMGGMRPLGPPESPRPWQRAYRPMENRPKSPTRLGEDPDFFSHESLRAAEGIFIKEKKAAKRHRRPLRIKTEESPHC